jgi:hypothetical protein
MEKKRINIEKQYAIYFRFNEITKDIKQRLGYGYIHLNKIHEQIADEFGYKSTRMVTEAINFIRKNRTEPFVQRAALLFSSKRINHWEKYSTKEDLQNIEKINQHIHSFFGVSCGGKHTKTPFIHYFIYKRFHECKQQDSKAKVYDIYDLLADEFHYQNKNSIRNIVKKVSRILCKKKNKRLSKRTSSVSKP